MADTELELLLRDWERSLRADNKAPRTVQTYLEAGRQLAAHLATQDDPPARAVEIRRRHVEAYLIDVLERHSAATARARHAALRVFFGWLAEEEDIASPMARVRPPKVPLRPVPVIPEQQLSRLLAGCAGKDFESRRDLAILRTFIDTGVRLAELTGLALDDVDLDDDVLIVLGKGRKLRSCPFGPRTAQALSRYLRARLAHPRADAPRLWLGMQGPLTPSGVAQMLRRRGAAVGLPDLHPHQFRHTFAHLWLAEDGNEGALMSLAGWESRDMLRVYGRSAADQRAHEAHRRLRIADRL
ncbi:MAG: tyrosine-type recombinase/integrase [Frankiaceae bacterium]